jgi:hypothetical protein
MTATDDLLTASLADLDDDVLVAIIDSASAQADYLGRFPRADTEARTMATVCGLIATAAEAALIKRRTGVSV